MGTVRKPVLGKENISTAYDETPQRSYKNIDASVTSRKGTTPLREKDLNNIAMPSRRNSSGSKFSLPKRKRKNQIVPLAPGEVESDDDDFDDSDPYVNKIISSNYTGTPVENTDVVHIVAPTKQNVKDKEIVIDGHIVLDLDLESNNYGSKEMAASFSRISPLSTGTRYSTIKAQSIDRIASPPGTDATAHVTDTARMDANSTSVRSDLHEAHPDSSQTDTSVSQRRHGNDDVDEVLDLHDLIDPYWDSLAETVSKTSKPLSRRATLEEKTARKTLVQQQIAKLKDNCELVMDFHGHMVTLINQLEAYNTRLSPESINEIGWVDQTSLPSVSASGLSTKYGYQSSPHISGGTSPIPVCKNSASSDSTGTLQTDTSSLHMDNRRTNTLSSSNFDQLHTKQAPHANSTTNIKPHLDMDSFVNFNESDYDNNALTCDPYESMINVYSLPGHCSNTNNDLRAHGGAGVNTNAGTKTNGSDMVHSGRPSWNERQISSGNTNTDTVAATGTNINTLDVPTATHDNILYRDQYAACDSPLNDRFRYGDAIGFKSSITHTQNKGSQPQGCFTRGLIPAANDEYEFDDGFDDDMDEIMADMEYPLEVSSVVVANQTALKKSTSKNHASRLDSPNFRANTSTKNYDNGSAHSALDKYGGNDFPFSRQIQKIMIKVFGLKQFRKHQLQAVNATMLGRDTFILMPTGGGKSLCYQLPAVASNGVTIVISPLLSLIQDQVSALVTNNIKAFHIGSNNNEDKIFMQLRQPGCNGIKLIYVTPEKCTKSPKTMKTFEFLYANKALARVVIDEAHCVSQCGHDFRPDYKQLNIFKKKFPDVPVMALTATATERVKKDVCMQLGLKNDYVLLQQSFNRPNLRYFVNLKNKKSIDDIIFAIKNKYKKQCGIIYCYSRNDTENTAAVLANAGISASHYHAGLSADERYAVQQSWQMGKTLIMCATIAFGMGIDKPDVRFVVHYSIPNSIEGYYQESGRGGRDGKPADCILYYSYGDKAKMEAMFKKDLNLTPAQLQTKIDALRNVIIYCENNVECRRLLTLSYFGDKFDPKNCHRTCDNCMSTQKYKKQDFTSMSKSFVECVREVRGNETLLTFLDILRGSQCKKIMQSGFNNISTWGVASSLPKGDCERLLHHLVLNDFLMESININKYHQNVVTYLKLGKKASSLLNGYAKVIIDVVDKLAIRREAAATKKDDNGYETLSSIQKRLWKELSSVRMEVSVKIKIPPHTVMNDDTLLDFCRIMPRTVEEAVRVLGFTRAKADKFGQEFVDKVLEIIPITEITLKSKPSPTSVQDGATSRHFNKRSNRSDNDFVNEDIGNSTTQSTVSRPKRQKVFAGEENSRRYSAAQQMNTATDTRYSSSNTNRTVTRATDSASYTAGNPDRSTNGPLKNGGRRTGGGGGGGSRGIRKMIPGSAANKPKLYPR